jgi:hypothetical protein
MDASREDRKTELVDGFKNILSGSYSFLHAIIILIVVSISLYNLTFQIGDVQLWRDLLLFTFGLVIPTPQGKKMK